ncbi:hypothetical protein AMATHDRAFT_46193 [Amanita thiersii Skay4041]|uniref:GAR domain-containing protein n=1 Tax=Amanita thiersii Skay4041 TaxID=703135 RepID=A0A2A9NWD2_9AGAR|nr:hypothetical protein AMATHDRAFT_46193 [Amanita thiersii Skay4041]
MSINQVTLPGDRDGSSGTAVQLTEHQIMISGNPPDGSRTTKVPLEGEEQALESHEVIELQTFSERKAWIEEKIRFLERMPPIEVFVGLGAIRASAEHIPGLATREELQQWIAEHDAIEKETEIFDKGELKKLRQLTKAATQRNLSPEDTDLIELTLTTIYELDRLLHLLRGRSENLELLGVRLSWEEHRIAAWGDLRKLLDDLKAFVTARARWVPSVYETITAGESKELTRRGSIASIASASDTSNPSAAFSRSARFKLAELLSRDAAQFSGRITSLRHGKIAAAGKVLDKLIDISRKPVPEELLDEQEKLEEKGINELEHVGKFIMNLVMQWRKADEIYVETKKDQSTALTLLEEIETAKLQHPTTRQSSSFTSRSEALVKRLSVRGNPASATSTFPRPDHFLFPDQNEFNRNLTVQLSTEISHATTLVQRVDALTKEYRKAYGAVKRAETLLQEVNELSAQLELIIEKLASGVSNKEGDGSVPDLSTELCLEPTAHSVYLALLPDVLEQTNKVNNTATDLLQRSQSVVLALDFPGIDSFFKTKAVIDINKMRSQRDQVQSIREDIMGRVYRLKEARKIWSCMGVLLTKLEEIRGLMAEAMEKFRWRQQTGRGSVPLTPDSAPSTPILPLPTHAEVLNQLMRLEGRLSQEVESPFVVLSFTLENSLKESLSDNILGLKTSIDAARSLVGVLESIQMQSAAMGIIRDECNDFQVQIEDIKIRLCGSITDVLADRLTGGDIAKNEVEFQTETNTLEKLVRSFIGGLLQRVPFVDRRPGSPNPNTNFVKRRYSSADLKHGIAQQRKAIELPFELCSLDDAVRADCNSYTITLNGKLESLLQLNTHLKLARMSKEVGNALKPLIDEVNGLFQTLNEHKTHFVGLGEVDKLDQLSTLLETVEQSSNAYKARISRSLSFVRETVRRMQEVPASQDPAIHESLLLSRIRAVDDLELRLTTWYEDVTNFKDQISSAHRRESQRVQDLRLAEERRLEKENKRLAAEEAERMRLEQERIVNEKLKKLEEERLADEERQRREMERISAEIAEREELERQRREKEEQQRTEEKRLAEEKRAEEDRRRQAAEAAEKARLQQERMKMEERLRQVEEQLVEERRLAAERSERERTEAEATARALEEAKRTINEQLLGNALATEGLSYQRPTSQQNDDEDFIDELTVIVEEKTFAVDDVEEDIFGFRLAPDIQKARSPEMLELQAQVLALRKRLLSVGINEALRPSKNSSQLPTPEQYSTMNASLISVSEEVSCLPSAVEDFTVDMELRSLRTEIDASYNLMKRVKDLADLSGAIKTCERALSDLLEHLDSYPSLPLGLPTTSFQPSTSLPPEKQLSARLTFTKQAVTEVNSNFALVRDDMRAVAECSTVQQTWLELEEMVKERLGGGRRTRPPSASSSRPSSGRNSSASIATSRAPTSKKASYTNLSASTSTPRGRLLVPPTPNTRRAVSGGPDPSKPNNKLPSSRPPSQLSSRPVKEFRASVYGSTYSSRQRTASLSNATSPLSLSTPRSSTQVTEDRRSSSPALSESSTLSRSVNVTTRTTSSTTRSSWARAPRNSLSSFVPPRIATPPKAQKPVPPAPTAGPRKKYIPDPKSKLDVAVGDVVNKLPVGINVEGVTETWKDKSGKYWIGNQDPKLCFCRILRSHTVMVRVGGGWSELSNCRPEVITLSRFIKDHFAESFRILPPTDSPPRAGPKEEKWISSATLLESTENGTPTQPQNQIVLMVPRPPSTPEPGSSFPLPLFAVTTPSVAKRSPLSAHSSPSTKGASGGSPLTPMQFLRRADYDPTTNRPVTPSKPPSRARNVPPTPSHSYTKQGVWRP